MNYLEKDNVFYPDFKNDFDECIPNIGKYGHLRLEYLKIQKPTMFLELRRSGTLIKHLQSIEEEAVELLILMEDKYIEKNPLPKGDDFMARVRAYNQARAYAEEIVLNNLIYS